MSSDPFSAGSSCQVGHHRPDVRDDRASPTVSHAKFCLFCLVTLLRRGELQAGQSAPVRSL